jgi:hypothetical protein
MIYRDEEYEKSYKILEIAYCDLWRKYGMYNAINNTDKKDILNELGFNDIFGPYQIDLRNLVIIAVSNLFSDSFDVISIKKLIACADFPKDKKAEAEEILKDAEKDELDLNKRKKKEITHISKELLDSEKFLKENVLTNNIIKNIIDKLPRLFYLISLDGRTFSEQEECCGRTLYLLERIATLEIEK